jgi:succinate dehydrogenase / fumarate reductase, iron-sulfur subunit
MSDQSKQVFVRIKRQKTPDTEAYWETFSIPYRPRLNVIAVLQEIAKKPKTTQDVETAPIAYDCSCLEEVCGACSMVINGHAQQACSTLIDKIGKDITLEPMSTFPILCDLKVDRTQMFDALKRIQGWIEIDGTHDLGPGPRMRDKDQQMAYEMSKCMTCGVCLEVCPQVNARSSFIGPAAISQARLFNSHPTGAMRKEERLGELMKDGGIAGCGKAQNCVRACPKGIPLVESISTVGRQTTFQWIKSFFED